MTKYRATKQNIEVIVLLGPRDFGRCPLASSLHPALWPVGDTPAVERLLQHLSRHGIKRATVCSNGDVSMLRRSIAGTNSMELSFLDEPLPAGSAGCIRDAASGDPNSLLLVLHAGMVLPPSFTELIHLHRKAKADLTIMFEPCTQSGAANQIAEIYICEPAVLKCIPQEGYCDIKEGLIPEMVRAGKSVHAATLSKPTGSFRDRTGYLRAIGYYLENSRNEAKDFLGMRHRGQENIWLADTASFDPSARIVGPVIIMDNAVVAEKTIIFGPTVIGPSVTVGKNALIESSVFWNGSRIGQNCRVRDCVVDYETEIPRNTVLSHRAISFRHNGRLENALSKTKSLVNANANKLTGAARSLIGRAITKLPAWTESAKFRMNTLRALAVAVLTVVFFWSYWPTFEELWSIWLKSDEYSSGLLVPLLALYVLWARRRKIVRTSVQPSLWGLLTFIVAQLVREFGSFFLYASAERLSLILAIAGLTLLLFGWQILWKVGPVLLFLCLMLPLPRPLHNSVTLPLQSLATASSVFCLEMMGYPVAREGNIIHINETTVAVAEACNGLRMVTAFFVVAGLVVLLVRRLWWEKMIVLLSSLPTALLCNTIRLTVTAIAFTVLTGGNWERVFHDFGGYAMMPLALAVVLLELWLFAKLTTIPEKSKQKIITRKLKN
jgi:exosortase